MIEFESVSKTFRDGTAAVVDLSITIPTGQITVIVGPSGCGKTTTLRMVNRMIEPTAGRITWDGNPLKSKRKTALRRQMGYVIQSGGLFPHRTVLDNIGTVPGLLGWSKAKTQQRSLELLGSVGLDRKLAHRYPVQLSGGQQQRVGVARALAADPLVLLMDEPFSAVDPVVRSELHEFFLGLQRQISKTIILITHDIDEAIKLGDQVVIMHVGGRLAQAGTPQQVLNEPADAFVEGFVGRDRGYRSLSFLPADGLELGSVKVVRDVETPAGGDEPTLVVDGDASPVGWLDRQRPGRVLGLGATFVPETDTLRNALDSALTSPFGLAVAVEKETRRFAGVVTAREILQQVTGSRAEVAESISIRDAEAARGAQPVADAPQTPAADEKDETADESAATAEAEKVDESAATAEAENVDESAATAEAENADERAATADADESAATAEAEKVDSVDGADEVDSEAEPAETADVDPADDPESTQAAQPAAPSSGDDDDDVTAVIDKVRPEDSPDGAGSAEVERENDVTVVAGEPIDLTSSRTDDEKDPVR